MSNKQTIDERIITFLGLDWEQCGWDDHQELFHRIRGILKQRECDNVDFGELLKLFKITLKKREKKHTTLKEFYNWLLDFRVDNEDLHLYRVYLDVAHQLGAPEPDPVAFAGRGENLRLRIDEWRQKGKTKNDPEKILYDYCEGVIRMCEKGDDFTRERLHNPSALFQRFGWNLWLQYVEERWSDEWNYLIYSDEYLKARDKELRTLVEIKTRLHNHIFAKEEWSQKRKMNYQTIIGDLLNETDIYETLRTIKELEKEGKCPLEYFFVYKGEEGKTNNGK